VQSVRPVVVVLVTVPLLIVGSPGPVAAQSSTAISPFVSYVPSAVENPLVGMALTFGGTTGLALRAGADMSVENPRSTDATGAPKGGYRPWAADADAMLYLGGLGGGATVFSRTLSPYVFAGIGMNGGDSAGINVTRNSWSYGAGATIPLGWYADLFGEARWRLQEYVLPTAKGAPDSKSEMRFGISFHVGGNEPRRPRRRHYDDDEDRVAAAPAPPPPQTIIVQQPAAPPPQTVIVQQPAPQPTVVVVEPDREPRNTVNVNFPIIFGSRSRHRDREVVVVRRSRDREPVWVPAIPVITRTQRDPQPTLSCTRTQGDRRSGSDTRVCVVKPD